MCGFSATIPDDGNERFYIGAPGAYYWQGTIFAQSVRNPLDRPNTRDGPAHHDNYNLGELIDIYRFKFKLSSILINHFAIIDS